MNIGQAATASGVSAKAIRYYETAGLIMQAGRSEGGYRVYDNADIRVLRFIRRARDLGFSIERIRELLRLWSDRDRASAEVKTIALAHAAEIEAKIAHMREIADLLHSLADACEGDHRPECPIIDSLADSGETRVRAAMLGTLPHGKPVAPASS